MEAVKIRDVLPSDLQAVASLQDQHLLSKVSPEHQRKMGFLVSGFKLSDYKTFQSYAEYFNLLLVGEEPAAFLLAYNSEHINAEKEELNHYIRTQVCLTPFILLKQVSTHPRHVRKGLATKLYIHLKEVAREKKRPIYTVIVKEPRNEVSIAFHEKLGFRFVLEYTPKGQMPRLVYCCEVKNDV